MVQTLLSLTEVRDAETGRHSRRTQQYARLLAEQLATHPDFRDYLTPERIDLLSSLAPLHDIGKVGVPDHILNKPGALTPEELAEMRKHPALGRDVILKAEQQVGVHDDATSRMAKDIVYTHHERWDGTGYPQGLRGTRDSRRGTGDGDRRRVRRHRHQDALPSAACRTTTPSSSSSGQGHAFRSGRRRRVRAGGRAVRAGVAAESDHKPASAKATADQTRTPVRRDVPSAPLAARTATEQP